MKVAGYIRVGLDEQPTWFGFKKHRNDASNQEKIIREYCEKHNYEVVQVLRDVNADEVAQCWNMALGALKEDAVDKIIVTSFDRIKDYNLSDEFYNLNVKGKIIIIGEILEIAPKLVLA